MTRTSLSLRWDGRLSLLDQQALPFEERWVPGDDLATLVGHIQALRVRGAPAIGVAAALGLASLARQGWRAAALVEAAAALRRARPTAVNLMWAVDRLRPLLVDGPDLAERVEAEAVAIFDEDVACCEAMARHGRALLQDGDGVLTHCNTGGLATAGVGTALGVVRRAWEAGIRLHVWVDETRPLLQGARLTAWELGRLGIPHTLLTDAMAALVLRDGRVQRVLVGADRVAANGDFANKVGTYGLAVLARAHGVPFHAVAPWSTVDLGCPDGAAIPVESRDPAEVRGFVSAAHTLTWAPAGTPVFNPAFDVTPAALTTSLVTDRGVFAPHALPRP